MVHCNPLSACPASPLPSLCRKFNQGDHMARCSLMLEEPKKAKGRGKGGAKARGGAVDEEDVDIGALEEGEAPPVQVRKEGGEGGGDGALPLGGCGGGGATSGGTDAH